jgi:hypothetical protein
LERFFKVLQGIAFHFFPALSAPQQVGSAESAAGLEALGPEVDGLVQDTHGPLVPALAQVDVGGLEVDLEVVGLWAVLDYRGEFVTG